MFELTTENASQYLAERNLIPTDAPVLIEPLGWGISNTVIKISLPDDCFVLKQPLARLQVEDDWPFDQRRVLIERDCMLLLGDLLPAGSVPTVRFSDEEFYIFAMSCVSDTGILWKQALLDGDIDLDAARMAATLLVKWHNRTADHPQANTRFADNSNFIQGRIEPYHLTTARAHPDLAPVIEAEVERMLGTRLALVHGDYSPKNIFVFPDRILTLDFEVAHYGDPAFDTAFCLNHLILKTIKFPLRVAGYLGAARIFWHTYLERLSTGLDQQIEMATVRELGCLLLARIDGKSKVEYITDEPTRDIARRIARDILLQPPTSLSALFKHVEQFIAAPD